MHLPNDLVRRAPARYAGVLAVGAVLLLAGRVVPIDELYVGVVVGVVALWLYGVRQTGGAPRDGGAPGRHSDLRFASLFAASPYPLGLFEVYSGRILDVNDRVTRISGIPREQLIGRNVADLPCWDNPEFPSVMAKRLLDEGAVYNLEVGFRGPEARRGVALVSAHLVDVGGTTCVLAAMNDITDRKALEQALTHQAFHDDLTHLANRALFSDRVQHALTRTNRATVNVAVLFLDLDDFKRVNDSLGHAAGDELLRQLATRLQPCLRASDTLARLGGDEFAILIEDIAADGDAEQLASRIIPLMHAPFALSGSEIVVGMSIGIAFAGADATAETLIRDADLAMYMAKGAGKGRAVVFEPDMHAAAAERFGLELDLRTALESGQFQVHYQPIMAIPERRIVAAEALLRWNHPTRGFVPPSVFISIAEDTGLIKQLGVFILQQACTECVRWQRETPTVPRLGIAVNLSARQIIHDGLVDSVRTVLRATGLSPDDLTLEITESVLVHNDTSVIQRLWALKELGVHLAIDDFGTGYSSLAYLQRFPVDVLKIDRSFVQRIGETHDSPIARAVIGLGRTLGLRTIVEGVETPEQLRTLRDMGCGLAQGYLFGLPGPASHFSELLAASATRRRTPESTAVLTPA